MILTPIPLQRPALANGAQRLPRAGVPARAAAPSRPVLQTLRGDPAVEALHTTNGRWDIVAELHADSLEAFDRVLGRLRQLEGVSRTETSLLLSTFKL